MSNQELFDEIEFMLPRKLLPADLKEKILDAIWDVIVDNREEPKES